ncbi:MAG: site-specific DNA-methyltransferase [Nocardioidaceae bacterium]
MIDLDPTADYVVHGDNAVVLPQLPSGSVQLVYIDPPFNTGGRRDRRTLQTRRDPEVVADRTGFAGRRYSTVETARRSYPDSFSDYAGFLAPRLEEARRLLTESGTLYVHLDWREAHYCKVLLDDIFGRECFLNEVIWAYDYGGRSKDRWPAKHDTLLVYVRTRGAHLFDQDQIERIPYLAPTLVGPEKAARGKLPTDVWWHTIVATGGREKTGYPTQKPEGVLRRVLAPSTRPGDRVLDFFAGSGTTGAVAAATGRRYVLVDDNPDAVQVMRARLGDGPVYVDATGRVLVAEG